MKRAYDYLELYKNSYEVKAVLAPYDVLLNQIADEIMRVKNVCFLDTTDESGLKDWLKLYDPSKCSKLDNKQRVHDALSFFAGAPLSRIRQIAARATKTNESREISPDEVFITEYQNNVHIGLPVDAEIVQSEYLDYLDNIKPAHVMLHIYRRRRHEDMRSCTHEQLSQYTHSGVKIKEDANE